MPFDAVSVGLTLVIAGIALGLWKEKRQFDRTNSAGVEEFWSFGRKMVATTIDDLLYWGAIASLLVGLLMLGFG